MTPQRTLQAEIFFAKAKFVQIKYKLEKDFAEKLDTFYESASFFAYIGNLERAREELVLANIQVLPHLTS